MTQITKQLKQFYWVLIGKDGKKILLWYVRNRAIIFAAYIWRRLLINTTFIAITGSVGKTTTKEFLATILKTKYRIMSTQGSHNHRKFKGLERTILRTRPWHKFSVIEVGTEEPGDMEDAAKFLKPDVVIMLNIKHCHTNAFKTLESLADEKSQLLKYLGDKGCVILNQDNSFIADMTVNPGIKVIRFGSSEASHLRLISAESKWPERLKLSIAFDGVTHDIETLLLGAHWAPTIMASLVTSLHCGIPITDAIDAMRLIEPVWGRMRPIHIPLSGATIIRDDWVGSIDTFDVALKVLADATASRKIVVFSDFSDSKKNQRARAKQIGIMAENYADFAIFVGDYADKSVKAATAAGMDDDHVFGFFSLSEAIAFLNQELQQGDLVLIKGKVSHHLSRIYLGLIGSVKCNVLSCSRQGICDTCSELGFEWVPELQDYMAAPDSYL